jgi:hypothetical protein
MTDQPDVLAAERFRNIVAEAIDKPGMDAPWNEAQPVLDRFPEVRFERHVNENGVAVRRVVVVSEWEVDPIQPQHEGCKVHGSAGCPVCDPEMTKAVRVLGPSLTSPADPSLCICDPASTAPLHNKLCRFA